MTPSVTILRDDRFTVRIGRTEVQGLTLAGVEAIHYATGSILGLKVNTHQDRIISEVCRHYDIRREEMMKDTRLGKYIWPRQVAMYLVYQLTTLSTAHIGELFGGRDHGTVLHAHKKVKTAVELEPRLSKQIEEIVRCVDEVTAKAEAK